MGAVRDSAAIIIQATSGMRVSELLGILAESTKSRAFREVCGLELSATGLYEWFVSVPNFLRPRKDCLASGLVLGMRPVGVTKRRSPCEHCKFLTQLYEPLRACARTDRLILAGRNGATLPVASLQLGAMTNDKANEMMNVSSSAGSISRSTRRKRAKD